MIKDSGKNQTKVFIAGAPRSGTSIMLFAIKDVFGLPGYGESHVIPAFAQMVHTLFTYMKEFERVDKSVLNEILLSHISVPEVRVRRSFRISPNAATKSLVLDPSRCFWHALTEVMACRNQSFRCNAEDRSDEALKKTLHRFELVRRFNG
jgi:hypothetical protein